MAVLPPPSTITRLPILSIWPNETRRQPVDADMDVGRGFLAAGDVEVAAARRAGADEDRVVAFGQQRLQAVDPLAQAHLEAEVGDVADLLVDDRFGQAEAAGSGCGSCRRRCGSPSKIDDVVAERRQIARHGQRGRAGADQGDALAVAALCGALGRRRVMSPL